MGGAFLKGPATRKAIPGITRHMLAAGGGTHIANDLVGGQGDSAMLVLSTAMPFLKDGKIRALWNSDTLRVLQLPHIKRIGMAMPLWQRLFMKAGPPAARVTAVDKALQESLAKPELRQKLQEIGHRLAQANFDYAPRHRLDLIDDRQIGAQRLSTLCGNGLLQRSLGAFGSNLATIAPFAVAQPEDIAQPVVGYDPAIGQCRDDIALFVKAYQPLNRGRTQQFCGIRHTRIG